MLISAIVAIGKDGVIGKGNEIPWYLPADLKYFKKITTGHHILMGRKCFESIGKALPNRTNIIVTRDPYFIVSNCYSVSSIEEGIHLAQKHDETELFVIGGGEIYNQTKDYWDKIYLTEVDYQGDGEVFFPTVEWEQWSCLKKNSFEADEINPFFHTFSEWELKHKSKKTSSNSFGN
ncbi:MAG TPA: dihydrofolate reductase [Saprospiraceae bacterium]|nr:dihydrofolate reductase [Saprospiraceae bacterium]